MRNLIITVIVTFLGVANAAKDDLKFVTESSEIKPIVCKTESASKEESPFLTEEICNKVEKEKCGGKPCASLDERKKIISERMDSDNSKELQKQIQKYANDKFKELKNKYKDKCGKRFATAKINFPYAQKDGRPLISEGIGGPQYDQYKNIVQIPRWKLFDSTAQEIDELLIEQLGSACLFSKNWEDSEGDNYDESSFINLDRYAKAQDYVKDGMIVDPIKTGNERCAKAFKVVEQNLAKMETGDQKECRKKLYKNLKIKEPTCVQKYDDTKKAFTNLVFLEARTQVSHWSRGCSSSETVRFDMECYIKKPNSNFKRAICDPKAAKDQSDSSSAKGGK